MILTVYAETLIVTLICTLLIGGALFSVVIPFLIDLFRDLADAVIARVDI